MSRVYDEIVDFIAAGSTPAGVASFQPSEQGRNKVFELIQKEKEGGLTADEKSELDHYMQIEHLMRLAKARAKGRLGRGVSSYATARLAPIQHDRADA
jgi:hypothetical protein